MECTVRCWRCCIKAEHPTAAGWLAFINRELAGPRFIRIFEDTVMCELLTANDDLQTHCLIYAERPTRCRRSLCQQQKAGWWRKLCLKVKQCVHAATRFGYSHRPAQAATATATSSAPTAAR